MNWLKMGSNDTSPYSIAHDCQLYEFMTEGIITGLLCTFGLIGNIVAFVTFVRIGKHNASTVLFQALAIFDSLLLLCSFVIFVPGACGNNTESPSQVINEVVVYSTKYLFLIGIVSQVIAKWISVLLTINRYIAVCKPFVASRLCTITNARKQLCVVIVLCQIVLLPFFFETYITIDDIGNKTLDLRPWAKKRWYLTLLGIVYMLSVFIIPFTAILILGLLVISGMRAAKRMPIRRHSIQGNPDNSITHTVFAIILVFLICQTPALVNQLLWSILPADHRRCGGFQFYFQRISNTLVILNSGVNCLIYMVFNRTFRKNIMRHSFEC